MASIKLKNVSIDYPIYNAKAMSLRSKLVTLSTGGRFTAQRGHVVTVKALDGISLELSRGDRLGLIGHNGSGKTTLLRTMAGIFSPTQGTVTTEGSISSFFGLGAGMDLELSGYENITRMALLLGMTHIEIARAMPDIEEFTELGDFLSLPMRTYSAGMQTRLTFAVATATKPDILLIDEVINAGDTEFQEKAHKRMNAFIEKSSIFVLASHDPHLLRKFCNKTITLEHGKITTVPSETASRESVDGFA